MSDLRKRAVLGAKWSSASTIVVTLLELVQLVVLARLLTPQDFGLMAMVMLFLVFAQSFADLGVSAAIIHRENITQHQLSSLYWLTLLSGVIVAVLFVMVSPLVVLFYREESLQSLLLCIALVFIIGSIGQQFEILMQKNLMFKRLSFVESSASLFGVCSAIFLAWLGFGVWSLVWGRLISVSVRSAILSWYGFNHWLPQLYFSLKEIKEFIGFGLFQMGDRCVNYFNQRVDQLLIGSLLGAQALGFYSLAFNLVIQPISKINPLFTRVAFPVFSKINTDNERLRCGFMTLRHLLSTINSPLLLGLFAISPTLIPFFFGEQWESSVELLQLLVLVAFFRSMGNPIGSLLLAKGRADLGFKWNVAIFFVQIPVLYFSIKIYGVTGAIVALLVLELVYFPAEYQLLIRKLIGRCFSAYLSSALRAFFIAVLMVMVLMAIPLFVELPLLALLMAQIILGALIYVTMYWLIFPDSMKQLIHLMVSK